MTLNLYFPFFDGLMPEISTSEQSDQIGWKIYPTFAQDLGLGVWCEHNNTFICLALILSIYLALWDCSLNEKRILHYYCYYY